MKTLIAYDSVFGNTERLAKAMGEALAPSAQVLVKRASEVKSEELRDLGLLILASPTRAFSPTKGAKDFLAAIPAQGLAGTRTAAFDTRIAVAETGSRLLGFLVKIFGYAAEPLAKGLVRKGGKPAAPAEGFFVQASEGPLKDGELERGVAWARGLLQP